jgi:hypothetical protein
MVKPSGGGTKFQHEATSRFGRMATASGAAPFSMQFKSKFNTALSWGRNEMNSAQSLQESENHHTPATSRWAYGIPSWQFLGLVPFPYSSKPSTTIPQCLGRRKEMKSKPRTTMPRCFGRRKELNSIQSPVFRRSGPLYPKQRKTTKHQQHLAGRMEFPLGSS